MQVCRNQAYRGHVQGVGFRWTVRRIAEGFAVAGWVKNRPDGSVELLVEGESADVNAFLQEVQNVMQEFIRDTTGQTMPPSGTLHGFDIRH